MAEPVVIGALVGGGIAIVTTLANLAFNWWRGEAERQSMLRQQVYLGACDWAARGTEYLASFARLDLDDAQLAQIMQAAGAAFYRVHLVAAQPTVLAFTAAADYIGSKSLELMTTRVKLRQRALQVEALRGEAEQTASYLTQARSIIDSIPKAAPSQELLATIPRLVVEFTGARDQLQHTQTKITTLQQEINALREQLLAACLTAAVGYGQRLVTANVAARKELGLPLNEESYRQSVGASSRRMLAGVEEMVKKFKEERRAPGPSAKQ